jgi:hypothetical protein
LTEVEQSGKSKPGHQAGWSKRLERLRKTPQGEERRKTIVKLHAAVCYREDCPDDGEKCTYFTSGDVTSTPNSDPFAVLAAGKRAARSVPHHTALKNKQTRSRKNESLSK